MEYHKLGQTDLYVSPLGMGTGEYGAGLPRESAKHQLDAFIDRGANFIDTAHIYSDWVPGEIARSEGVIGEWLRDRKCREKVVISTKGAHPRLDTMHIPRCSPGEIEQDMNGSLSRLGTDYIDLYFLHRDDPALPVALILDCLEKARKQGKIRYYGCSNWTLPRVKESEAYARQTGIAGFSCNQIKWSLAETNVENIQDKSLVLMDNAFYDWHKTCGMSVTAYSSTAGGWFAKLFRGNPVSDQLKAQYENEINRAIFGIISEAASELSLSITAISLGYIMMGHPFSSVPLTSFNNDRQFEEGMHACEVKLPPSLIRRLNAAKGLPV
jgi:aryl-alcohol dehydrogenase-like predicted oxidoreductase